MAHSDKIACGKALVLPVRNADRVREIRRQYAQQTGVSEEDIHITFRGTIMDDADTLHKHGIASGDLHLVSMGRRDHHYWTDVLGVDHNLPGSISRPMILAAATTKSYDSETITVKSSESRHPDLSFRTIRLSCESHPRTSSESNYAGFILYGWEDEYGNMLTDWRLNGKHCKSAYLVIQGTNSPGVKKCREAGAPGQVHGAVYWNVYGIGSDVYKAVGEGFALMNGTYKWNSLTFNANSDAYHDNKREISVLAKKCVENILDDWQRNSELGKTYVVKDLLTK